MGETLKRSVPADQLKLIRRAKGDAAMEPVSYKIDKITKHRTSNNGKF